MSGSASPEIVASTLQDVPQLVDCLCASFDTDPVINWFLRQDERRDSAFREFFDVAIRRQTLPFGEVFHHGDFEGVAMWSPPGTWRLSLWDQLLLFPSILRLIPRLRELPRILKGLQAMEDQHPQQPHRYLSFLCTHPDYRGQGIGHALLQAMLDQSDREGVAVYLENTDPVNLGFYQSHGFVVTGEIVLPSPNPPPYSTMLRHPQ
jgi:GNAT superfamily N-acetyltransferase